MNAPDHDPADLAEAAVLGAMMLSSEARDGVPTQLSADDFDRPAHRTLFEAVCRMHAAGQPVDHVTLGLELFHRGQLDEVGGTVALHELTDPVAVPAPSSWPAYATVVGREARRRRAIAKLEAALDRLRAGEDPAVVASWVGGGA